MVLVYDTTLRERIASISFEEERCVDEEYWVVGGGGRGGGRREGGSVWWESTRCWTKSEAKQRHSVGIKTRARTCEWWTARSCFMRATDHGTHWWLVYENEFECARYVSWRDCLLAGVQQHVSQRRLRRHEEYCLVFVNTENRMDHRITGNDASPCTKKLSLLFIYQFSSQDYNNVLVQGSLHFTFNCFFARF